MKPDLLIDQLKVSLHCTTSILAPLAMQHIVRRTAIVAIKVLMRSWLDVLCSADFVLHTAKVKKKPGEQANYSTTTFIKDVMFSVPLVCLLLCVLYSQFTCLVCLRPGLDFHEDLHRIGAKEGLKGRKLQKAMESYAWNITVLKVRRTEPHLASGLQHCKDPCIILEAVTSWISNPRPCWD